MLEHNAAQKNNGFLFEMYGRSLVRLIALFVEEDLGATNPGHHVFSVNVKYLMRIKG